MPPRLPAHRRAQGEEGEPGEPGDQGDGDRPGRHRRAEVRHGDQDGRSPRSRLGPRGTRFVAVAAALVLIGCWYAQLTPSKSDGEARALRAEPSNLAAPSAMEAQEAPRVLIFGDSIADQHGSHAAFALHEAGVETQLMTLWGQGLFSREQYDMGATRPEPPDGTLMAAASQAVDEFDPDIVAVYANHNYWPPYPRDAAGAPIQKGTEAFRAMVRSQLTELVRRLTAGGASVYLVKPVPERLGQTADDNAIWSAYMEVRRELGLGLIDSGDALASDAGDRVDAMADCAGQQAQVRPEGDIHLTYLGAGRMGTASARELAGVLGVPPQGISAPADRPAAMLPMGTGYRLVTCDGATFPFGVGSSELAGLDLDTGRPPGEPVVAAALAPPGDRAWGVTDRGHVVGASVEALGGIDDIGDDRAVGIASTSSGEGYWIATVRGAVHPFGDAEELGDVRREGDRVVAMAGTPDHRGYWLLLASGAVEGFGTARELGDVVHDPDAPPLVAFAPHPSGDGYWILDSAGNVTGFGDAEALGSPVAQDMVRLGEYRSLEDYDTEPVPAAEFPTGAVALLPTVSGDGYWVWLGNGAVCRFGDADALGGVHRAEIDEVMLFLGQPYYADGPCAQDVGFGSVSEAQIDASEDAGTPPL
jgi:hypothetical protein